MYQFLGQVVLLFLDRVYKSLLFLRATNPVLGGSTHPSVARVKKVVSPGVKGRKSEVAL